MSSTRHAPQGSAVSYERYMSSPEYAELRGIPGTAVAAKAQLYADIRKRSLLFFLQALSIKEGGLRFVARALVIQGESGIGKTTAVEAWCAGNQGRTRFVSLSGITHKTGFFRKLAGAIGLAAAKGKAIDLQVRVEEFFRKTQLMLVIDEANYLWPQYQRSYSSPELIDWVNTALVNHKVPVALICTDQFAKLKTRVETRTGWTSEQLEHRVKRYKKLPSTLTKEDLEAVAARLLAVKWNSLDQRWNASRDLG